MPAMLSDALSHVLSADLALAYGVVILAGIARGFTGFVAGLVNVALLTFIYGPIEAIAQSLILGFFASILLLRNTYRLVQWNETVPVGIAAAVAIPGAAMLLLSVDATFVRPVIGVLIAGSGLVLLTGWRYAGPRNTVAAAVAGAVSGTVQGFSGSGGPLMVLYFLASPEPAAVQRANIAIVVTVITVVQLTAMTLGGGTALETFIRALLLLPGTTFGTWAGIRLFEMAPQRIYQLVARWALIAIGVALILR